MNTARIATLTEATPLPIDILHIIDQYSEIKIEHTVQSVPFVEVYIVDHIAHLVSSYRSPYSKTLAVAVINNVMVKIDRTADGICLLGYGEDIIKFYKYRHIRCLRIVGNLIFADSDRYIQIWRVGPDWKFTRVLEKLRPSGQHFKYADENIIILSDGHSINIYDHKMQFIERRACAEYFGYSAIYTKDKRGILISDDTQHILTIRPNMAIGV